MAGQSTFFDSVYVFIAVYLPILVCIVAAILFFVWKKSWTHKLQLLFIFAIFVTISYLLIHFVFHLIWPRLRPFDGLGEVNKLIDTFGLSFPSRHAMLFFLIATVISWIRPKIGIWFFIVAILIAIGRVLVGVHYPSDILVGATFGTLMGIFTISFAKMTKLAKL